MRYAVLRRFCPKRSHLIHLRNQAQRPDVRARDTNSSNRTMCFPKRTPVALCLWGDNLKPSQSLRTVIWDLDGGHFSERAIRLGSVTDKLRRVPIDLVQESAIGRHPVIARPTRYRCIE